MTALLLRRVGGGSVYYVHGGAVGEWVALVADHINRAAHVDIHEIDARVFLQ